ncbi:MAG: hypothetical protein IK012_04235 [Fibrobacter sp.]|uniref:hypothetical protein n=1 Tax=Fibrobacter sp. TaxID=35828 RepID=UPI0025BADB82|nr:hypothetical protein [Fibrobacter sp.]MBR4784447.1 hypothetical protein [Fibrobacter sp.]
MEIEFNIAGRILAKDGTRAISLAEILASSVVSTAADLTEDMLVAYCKSLSAQNACKVYVWKDREEYGNANVFNGGSDYEVVNEICFLSICDCGKEMVRETTNHWNEKIDAVI